MVLQKIGRYDVEREIGHGGMSTVYLARDPHVKRQVAIKVLPRQFTHDPQFRTRFQREAELIASLEHPFIVSLYDFGEEDDQPYIVMRYMPGGTLLTRMKSGAALPLPQIARLLERVGEALDEAHENHIIHRDLKPGNILFDARGEAYLSDFGIAKVSENTAFTSTGIIGTPEYMSPEQARGHKQLDRRSDVYSLGVVLYQMLAGQLPFKAETPMGAAVAHITEPVPDIRTIKADLPPASTAIINCVLAKDPNDRYPTATDLARDVARMMTGQTISPPQPHERTQPLPGSYVPPPPPPPEPRTIAPERVNELTQLRRLRGHEGSVTSLAFSPDGLSLVSGGLDGTARIWELQFGQLMHTLKHAEGVWSVAYSPDGRTVVSGSRDHKVGLWSVVSGAPRHTLELRNGVTCVALSPDGQTLATGTNDAVVQLWDVASGLLKRTLSGHSGRVSSLTFSPDGKTLVSGGLDGIVCLWNASGTTGHLRPPLEKRRVNYIWSIAFSPDGRWLASGADSTILIWDFATGKLLRMFDARVNAVSSVAFSPDARLLVSGDADHMVQLWDPNTGQLLRTLKGHLEEVNSVAFSPDGNLIASASADFTIRLWGVEPVKA